MDVVCDRCKTEYEFDDALVSERGTTVKCTNCSHQFKIFRPSSEAEVGRAWTLRRPDGTVIPFDSLAVLQKWILEGRVSKMDEIARSGDGWKPLGAIAELETFFSSAESRGTPVGARPVSVRPPGRSLPPLRQNATNPQGVPRSPSQRVPPPAASTSQRPPAPPSHAILKGTAPMSRTFGGTSPGMPPPSSASVGDSTVSKLSLDKRTPLPAVPAPPVDPPLPSPLTPVPHAPSRAETPGHGVLAPLARAPLEPPVSLDVGSDDDVPTRSVSVDEPVSAPGTARRGGRSLAIAAVFALGIVGAAGLWRMGAFDRAPSASTSAAFAPDLGEVLRLEDAYSRVSLEDARDALTRMLGARPGDGAVLAARAQAFALWSEFARAAADEQSRGAQPTGSGPERSALAAVLREEATRAAERAGADFTAARSALARAPAGTALAEPEVALLDAARVLGLREEVARLRPLVEARAPRSDRAELVVALARADLGDRDGALSTLRQLVGRSGTARSRVALARMLIARGEAAEARATLASVAAPTRGVDELAALRAQLDAADAAVAVAPREDASTVSPAATAGGLGQVDGGLAAPAPSAVARVAPAPRDYDRLVSEGDRLQNEGRTAAAEERFRAALSIRSGGAEALTGMGYVELDRRNYSAALSRFRSALASNGSYSDAYIGMGETYSSQSRYEQALEAYQRYLAVNPGGSRASMARRQIESLQERVRRPAEENPPPSGGESGG